ncbi:GNAT family N-acetyltransferase [Candidatus Paracaedibacter symbiosus]|uniref:GNAT family N-acetyltransferase n=1 Tax=Candidatus Paracaedibacter symbiosus TaxID=244582 RepID=UPI000A029033|nr:GNAT family N-acetyltransferase [Candidatus Paracaedibacter symbiosus]
MQKNCSKNKPYKQITAIKENKIIAMAILVPEDSYCEIKYIVVVNNMRNEGLGSRILTYCEDWAWLKGFKEIYCCAVDSALNFLIKIHIFLKVSLLKRMEFPLLKCVKA